MTTAEELTEQLKSLNKKMCDIPQPEDILPSLILAQAPNAEPEMPKVIICGASPKPSRKKPRPPSPICIFGGEKKDNCSDNSEGCESLKGRNFCLQKQLAELCFENKLLREKIACQNQQPSCPPKPSVQSQPQDNCDKLFNQAMMLQCELDKLMKENGMLKSKLGICPPPAPKCKQSSDSECPSKAFTAEIEKRLKCYSKNTAALERHIESVEMSVKQLNKELEKAKQEREEVCKQRNLALETAEHFRRMARDARPKPKCKPFCRGPCWGNKGSCCCGSGGGGCAGR